MYKTIALPNQNRDAGKVITAASLGIDFAQQGKKVPLPALNAAHLPRATSAFSFDSYDTIFQADAFPANKARDRIKELPLRELHPFADYPFIIREDAAMQENVESILDGGAIRPCFVRPRVAGGYEVIAGARDVKACELAGRKRIPAVIQEMDDATATIMMVNANLPQEKVLPSELAWALRMKMEALCSRGRMQKATDVITLSVEILMEQTGKSKNQIYRYVHLTELIPDLLDMVDENKLGFSVVTDHLYLLSRKEQLWLLDSMSKYEVTPSISQAIRLKKHSKEGSLTPEIIDEVMSEEKKESIKVTLAGSKLSQYFPKSYTPRQMEDVIIHLLEGWHQAQATNN